MMRPVLIHSILSLLLALAVTAQIPESESQVRIVTFDVDATPPVGSAMAYDQVKRIDELSLRCRGIVLISAGQPIVLCAVDWIGIANEAHDAFRDALAEAAGTTRDRVAVHTLHQHDAPGADFTAEKIVRDLNLKGYERFDGTFHREVIQRAADAIRKALPEAQPVTHYGWGEFEVKGVASNRRILGEDGLVKVMRFTTARDPDVRAEPEGVIDPEVSMLSFWNDDRPLAVLSYYATHPQSYYRTGIPSPDFPGIARFLRGQSQPEALHVHFNGAGGNIGAGKYNDGNKENRILLAQKLAEGMRKAWTTTEKYPLTPADIRWTTEPVRLPPGAHLMEESLVEALKTGEPRGYIAEADQLAWLKRSQDGHAIDIGCLSVGGTRILHMPGELFVEYQLAAKAMRPDLDVAMAAYGDYGPGYIGTKIAYTQGGYETSERASNVAPESEAILSDTVRKLLGEPPSDRHAIRIPPSAPDQSLKSFEILDGFEMQLVASEPDVVEPVVVTYDENGQMYVAEYLKFPSKDGKSDGPDGRIRLLRDLDGNGHYEWSQVFANDLAWPTGICTWKGGVFVISSPDLWYFKDTDGDGEAEIREKIFTGFGFTTDEGTANNLIWGLDNWIYGAGSNSGGDIRPASQPDAEPISLRGRDFRFNPETLKFEALSGSEQFGNTFDDWGNRFICQNSTPAVHVVLPARYLARNLYLPVPSVLQSIWEGDEVYRASPVEAWRKARTKIRLAAERKYAPPYVAHDVFTGVSGITIYRGAAYPEGFQGNLFIGDVQSNLVHRRVLKPDGVSFKSVRADVDTEILRSKSNWFRPANFVNAPDGTLHVVDIHREFIETPDSMPDKILAMVDFQSGHEHGRIYRLAPSGFQAPAPPKLGSASTVDLVRVLENPNGWWRDTASRLIYERQDSAAIAPLRKLLHSSKFDLARLHALHALEGLNALREEDISTSLNDTSPGIREHAVRLSEPHLQNNDLLLDRLITLANDADPRVRFQVAFSLGESNHPYVSETLAKIAFQDADDPWMRAAVLSSPPHLAAEILKAEIQNSKGEGRNPNNEILHPLAEVVGARNSSEDVQTVLSLITNLDDASSRGLVMGLGKGLRRARSSLSRFVVTAPAAKNLLAEWITEANQTLENSTSTEEQRKQAIEMLSHAGYQEAGEQLSAMLDSRQTPKVQLTALRVLTGFNETAIPTLLIEAFQNLSPTVRSEMIETLLSRNEWTDKLFDAIEAGRIAPGYVLSQRKAQLMENGDSEIRTRARRLFGSESSPREKVIEQYRASLNLTGDRERGRKVFEQSCIACHRLGNLGQNVGPNLTTIQNRTPESLLIQILDPNREVLANFTQYLIELNDGSLVSGQIASESPASVTLQRAGGMEESILRQNIKSISGSGLSLMPEGLEQSIDHQQMSDLITLLTNQ
jgi:putative membrane-bound dehydrogenase-like protein